MSLIKATTVAVKNPTCHKCGNPTIRMKIFEPGPLGEKPDGTWFSPGWRCTVCRDVARFDQLMPRVELIEACCVRLKEEFEGDYASVEANFAEEKKTVSWSAGNEDFMLDDLLFCPFCGARLPTHAESVEGLEETKP
jgi:ribosomal protein L40E